MKEHAGVVPLEVRRDRLLRRSAELRIRIGVDLQVWQRPLAAADQALSAARWLRLNPQWPLGALLFLVVIRPRRALRWFGRGLSAWRLWHRLQPIVHSTLGAVLGGWLDRTRR